MLLVTSGTCPAGYRSTNGFYPCTPCAADTYWTAKDKCESCETGYTTVGIVGAGDKTKCYGMRYIADFICMVWFGFIWHQHCKSYMMFYSVVRHKLDSNSEINCHGEI